jgi:alkylation response protein AidB-like acyl-CoA dehydrogenase
MSSFSDDLDQFRSEVAAFIAEKCPQKLKDMPSDQRTICWGGKRFTFSCDEQRIWMENAASVGLTAPRWPVEYGGAGLTRAQEKIFREEMAKAKAPSPLESFGLWMLGPALLAFGTHEQKLRYLPDITNGRIRWCQGYSEPGAGSDLASVQTRAEEKGDHWVVNGSKIWTSYADKADWIFALIRTDKDAPKHKGISFMLIDMETQGVSTKPIKLISGASPFCETFFDDVVVPKVDDEGNSRIVGELNRGWDVAKHLLTHEREMIGGGGSGAAGGILGGRSLGAFIDTLDEHIMDDPVIRAQTMELEIDTLAMGMTMERYKDMAKQGGVGHASAMLKYSGTELNKRRYEILMSITGSDGVEWAGEHGTLAPEWLRTKANSIEGGTSEVMLDILSKRVLELPSS